VIGLGLPNQRKKERKRVKKSMGIVWQQALPHHTHGDIPSKRGKLKIHLKFIPFPWFN